MGGWFFGFCLFVYSFNLMIYKVMFLFLFTLLSSYLTSVWKMILVTVHFFFLLTMTTINYQFCVGGVCGAGCFPQTSLTSRFTGTAAPLTQGRPRGATPTGKHNALSTKRPPTRVSGLWCCPHLIPFSLEQAAKWY